MRKPLNSIGLAFLPSWKASNQSADCSEVLALRNLGRASYRYRMAG